MLDLSKLTPLPVGPVEYDNDVGPDDDGYWSWYGVNGAKFDKEADAEFYVLARSAFEVMMRRGWGVLPCHGTIGFWVSESSEGKPFDDRFSVKCPTLYWDDPFTALVEADAWYREHVESVANPKGPG